MIQGFPSSHFLQLIRCKIYSIGIVGEDFRLVDYVQKCLGNVCGNYQKTNPYSEKTGGAWRRRHENVQLLVISLACYKGDNTDLGDLNN